MKPHILSKVDKQKRRRAWYRLRRRQDDADTTMQYSEQDLQNLAHHQGGAGIIRPETGDLHLPDGLVESGEGRQANSPPKVMLIIIILAVTFISIISYFVSQMPPKN
jgi:hypothetical protein